MISKDVDRFRVGVILPEDRDQHSEAQDDLWFDRKMDNRCGRCGSEKGHPYEWIWDVNDGDFGGDEEPCGWSCDECRYDEVC